MTRGRSWAVWSLVTIATVLLLIVSMTVWSKRQLLNTDQWTSSSGRMLADPQIRAALSTKLVDLLYARVDVAGELRRRLPPAAQGVAPAAAVALETAAARITNAILATPRAQQLWENANRRAHTALVRVLEGKQVRRLQTANGDIVLDLRPLVERLGTRLGVADRLKANATPTTGEIVLIHAKQLDTAQTAVKLLNVLSVFFAFLVLALYGLAIWLARGRRRLALQVSGATILFVGLLLLIVRRVAGNLLLDSLVKTEANRPVVQTVWMIETDLLRDLAIVLVVYGLFAIVAGFLGGPSRPATWVRATLAPAFRSHVAAVYGVALMIFLALVAWGPVGQNRRLIGTVILAGVVALGLEVWRRQTIREFPEGWQPAAAANGNDPSTLPPTMEALERLNQLRAEGALTEPEFEAQKAALLGV